MPSGCIPIRPSDMQTLSKSRVFSVIGTLNRFRTVEFSRMTLAGGSVSGPVPYQRNPSVCVIRGRPATVFGELQDRRDESVEITTLGPVIDNRRSNGQAAVDDRGRWNSNTGFLN